jgi:tripartite-type tricarboxylate transporter receptor subunit TctC
MPAPGSFCHRSADAGLTRLQRKRTASAVLAALLSLSAGAALAQAWPAKPVRVIVPYPPGGVADITARIYTPRLAEAWNQSVLIDNRPGANGGIGAELAARSAPDGYTLLMATAAETTINPSVYPKLGYDTLRDFSPIALASHNPVVLVANAATPFRSLADLLAAAKAKPDSLAYGTPGNGSLHHLSMEWLRMSGGPALIHVPYKGGGPAAAAVVGGETPLAAVALAPALPHIKTGKLRALALAAPRRSSLAPEAPTFTELGFALEASNWVGLLAPAKTPAAIIARANQDMTRAAQTPDVRERFANVGGEAASSTPTEFAALIKAELARFAKVVKAAKVSID